MLKMIIAFIIFIIILLLYLHIQFHLKTSEDLEMYEVDWPSKEKLEEVCDLRQPLVFDFDCQDIISYINVPTMLSHHSSANVKVRKTRDSDSNTHLYIPLKLESAIKLFQEDKSSCYFTENNMDFLEETGLINVLKGNDTILQPYMTSNTSYDIMLGTTGSYTPFRYEIGYRNYLLLTQGSAQIKLAPPSSEKYLYLNKDYENMEFSSPINPWDPQGKYSEDFNKVKCIDFTLLPGKTLYIPAYWWYSVKFHTNSTSICSMKYKTYMNSVTIMPHLFLHVLQIQNIKRKIAKNFVSSKPGASDKSPNVEKNVVVEEEIIGQTVLSHVNEKQEKEQQEHEQEQEQQEQQEHEQEQEQSVSTFKSDI